jgi:dTDP-4-dehydrorhamnose 3,5-epimerase
MKIDTLAIPEVKEIFPKRFGDHRGFFSETYHKQTLLDAGINANFIQDNHSFSALKGTLRGLHYQLPPFAQAKLMRVVRGSIFDVAVDIREQSATFGKWVSAILSATEGNQLFIPEGFAHGFVTLESNTEVEYKVTNYYSPECERGLPWNDPQLAIDWPLQAHEITTSERDLKFPSFAHKKDLFTTMELAGATS